MNLFPIPQHNLPQNMGPEMSNDLNQRFAYFTELLMGEMAHEGFCISYKQLQCVSMSATIILLHPPSRLQ